MAFKDLSANSQDYLKVIWDLQEWNNGEAVQPKALAAKTGMKLSTVSGAITRLAAADLVKHTPYGGITLTAEGQEYALTMVRRHRLLESFLVKTLGYTWDEVHQEADSLEHAVSDELVERIDRALGRPNHDPHGDPIPTAAGFIDEGDTIALTQAPEGGLARVERVSDEDPDLLRYLTHEGIELGTLLRIGRKAPFSNSVSVTLDSAKTESAAAQDSPRAPVTLDTSAADYIRVRMCR